MEQKWSACVYVSDDKNIVNKPCVKEWNVVPLRARNSVGREFQHNGLVTLRAALPYFPFALPRTRVVSSAPLLLRGRRGTYICSSFAR